MSDIHIGKSPKGIAVLPFYGTAAVFFLILCVMLLLSSAEMTKHYFSPHLLAMVHTAALGWGTMMIFGAAYQLLPVICEKNLYSEQLAFVSYILLTLGTLLLIWSFWTFQTGVLMITGGTLVVLSAILYTITVFITSSGSTVAPVYKYFVISSALWLCITTIAGLLLAINLTYTFIPRSHLDMLKLHAHAGLAGWFLQLITGVSAKLVPMFILGKSKKTWLLYVAIFFQNIGLILFLFDGYFNPINEKMLVYAALVFVGILAWITYLADTYLNRMRKKTELLTRHTAFSFITLLLAFVLLPVSHYVQHIKWTNLYGVFLFLGWITAIILGKTFKTLPFIVWNNNYQHLNGTAKIPLPKHLYNHKLIIYQFYIYLSGFSLLALGMVLNEIWIIRVAAFLWIVLALVYLKNVMNIMFHKPIINHETITH